MSKETLKQKFFAHRDVTNELASMINQDRYSFKPAETSMDAETLIKHIMKSANIFIAFAAGKQPLDLGEKEQAVNLAEYAQTYTDETIALFDELSEDGLDELIDMTEIFGAKIPAHQVIELAIDHEIHHKGNLFVYLRMMGYDDLPLYVRT
ncbi:DinB family protein [Salisediminibacterium halotolerans]|uniref:Uncharacterized damage-inducible protein DinB (Forms a four-helix bundle) n=1 Tax=Salisediminibacterium halotolerans TaxID=517425 RepID=A0A1H9WAS5_9BACI|nr:DinB family protein [Salisediminibacterium haloalkalitolerans]SES31018.1 Uncharacterized damage-inducible protein DinB (forms a four-helix bundle) [Salisediminibacterium haloalkalitolerans]